MRRYLVGFVCLLMMLGAAPAAGAQACRSTAATGLIEGSLMVNGRERSFLAYLPASYDGTRPLPVLFVFHGFGSSPENIMGMADFNPLADEQAFIVVYPRATEQPSQWYNGVGVLRPFDDDRDVQFFDALLAEAISQWCVDAQRVYVVGFSMGGGMAHRLACERADRIAAFGTVAGAFTNIPNGCNPARPVPVMALHGLADRVVPFEGAGLLLPSVSVWVAEWASRNGCVGVPTGEPSFEQGVHFEQCANDAEVILITGAEIGHTWPGTPRPNRASRMGGRDDGSINATQLLWRFLARYTLP
jgi:polyhydroxybutyrate depolymerase